MTVSTEALPAQTPLPVTDTPAERLARGGGWWTLILALLMLLAVTESFTTAAWSDGLIVVRYAILGGALLAFALALTRWDGLFPTIYSLLASLFWIATCFNWFILRMGIIDIAAGWGVTIFISFFPQQLWKVIV
jgi:hypothetical protein